MPKPIISISDTQAFLSCPYSFWLRRHLNAWGAPGPALRLGTELHKYMQWWRGPQLEPAPPITEPMLLELLEAANLASQSFPLKSLAIEQPLFKEFETFILAGTPDEMLDDPAEHGIWSQQWKSVAKNLDVGALGRHIAFSPHEITYAYLWSENFPDSPPVLGTIVGTFRKLTKRDLADNIPVYTSTKLRRSAADTSDRFHRDILPLLERTAACLSDPAPSRYWQSCLGPFRNSPCPAYNHCQYSLPPESLDQLLPSEPRYVFCQPEDPGMGRSDV